MKRFLPVLLCLAILASCTFGEKGRQVKAAADLIERVTPGYSKQFELTIVPAQENDVYGWRAGNGKVELMGNNTISLAVAYYNYLKEYCKVNMSWCGEQMNLPAQLPLPQEEFMGKINAKWRVYLNYCSFSYSAAWWDWERWQKELDFMAMNGINMPLSIVGLEGVWYNALMRMGYTDQEAREYLVGPAYFAWQWMTNIESFGGPLPKSWIESHVALGKQIMDRQVELGMQPIQQGYSGCVPVKFKEKFPQARIEMKSPWCGFDPVAQLDPTDPLFQEFGRILLEEQKKLFGDYGFYATDPFHEGKPISMEVSYLNSVADAVLKLFKDFNPNAKWIMQGWSPQEHIVKAIPEEDLIILDISDAYYKQSQDAVKECFWGYPYVVGNLHNFGGRINMHGDLGLLASNQFYNAVKLGKNIVGSGLFMEGLGQNPIYYDLAFEMPVHQEPVVLPAWIKDYSLRRYGAESENAYNALMLLRENPYREGTNGVELSSIVAARPAVRPKKSGPNSGFKIPYDPRSLVQAQELLLSDAAKLGASEGYRFDIVDLQRQLMSNLGQFIHAKAADAFEKGNLKEFDKHSRRFLDLLADLDQVLLTREEYSFEERLASAVAWARNEEEYNLYDYNASMHVTQWGGQPEAYVLFDYAWKEWSGLTREYYLPRWEKFYAMLRECLVKGVRYDESAVPLRNGRQQLRANEFYSQLADWEMEWITTPKKYGKIVHPDEISTVQAAFAKWAPVYDEYVEKTPAEKDLEAIMQRNNAAGLAVAVVKEGKMVYTKTLGYRNMETKAPWRRDDLLRIASISKSFVATGILQLVEQGKLSLDADVSELMGMKFRNPNYPEHVITVRMLLSHTSSLSDSNGYFSFDSLEDKSWNSYEPGSKYQYCNLGYNTLGAIIEKVSGERFDQYISGHILKPLGVFAHHNVQELDPDRLVNIYTYNKADGTYNCSDAYPPIADKLENYTMGYSAPVFSPTGGLKISVADLAKVMMMHMNGGTLDGVKILDSTSSALMQSEIVPTNYPGEKYGMAMLRTNDLLKGHRLVGHDGLALGAHTAMFWHPEEKFGFVIMTNGCNAKTDKVFANILCESAECLYRNFAK